MSNSLKDLLLGKGWAGTTITRSETIERVNPLIRQFMVMNRHYRTAIDGLSNPAVADTLEDLQKTARADVGKLSETVLSCGGAAFNGTELGPEDVDLPDNEADRLFRLQDLEEAFQEAVQAELDDVEHQMRTRAILNVVQTNSEQRLSTLRSLTRGASRSTA
jgi:hypothetical protein